MSVTATLSLKEQAALMRELQANLNAARSSRIEEYATLGADFLAHVVETSPNYAESQTSDWAGFNESGIEFEHDGRKYTASVRITDVARKAERVEGVDFTPKKRSS